MPTEIKFKDIYSLEESIVKLLLSLKEKELLRNIREIKVTHKIGNISLSLETGINND